MERATPIDQLDPPQAGGGGGQENPDLLQSIMSDYQNVSSAGGAPVGVPGGVHEPANTEELVTSEQFKNMQYSAGGGEQREVYPQATQPGQPMRPSDHEQFVNQGYDSNFYEVVEEEPAKPMTMTQRVWNLIKLPLLVAVLIYLSNMRVINLYLTKYVPYTMNRLGGVSQIGQVLKAVLLATIFYVVTTFVL